MQTTADGQICHGDSGGPLMMKKGYKIDMYDNISKRIYNI